MALAERLQHLSKCVDFKTAILYDSNMKKRSSKIILTNEGRVLRELRQESKLSMKGAAKLLGLSDSTIAHIETGRMDAPKGARLERFLKVYGGIKDKSFYERARNFEVQRSPREELTELLDRANVEQIRTVLTIARGLLG